MAYFVTGGSGFLAPHVLDALHAQQPAATLHVLLRQPLAPSLQAWLQARPHVQPLWGDLTEPQSLAALPKVQGIFHLAALVRHSRQRAGELHTVNVQGTTTMVELAARHGARLVYVSTSGTVGCSRRFADAPLEDAPYCAKLVQHWPYYQTKIIAEIAARKMAQAYSVPLVIMRPPMLLGPGDTRLRATAHVARFLRQKLPFIIRGGVHFVDVRDVAQALVAAMQHPQPQTIYHLKGSAWSVEDFFGQLGKLAGLPAPRFILPYRAAWLLAQAAHHLGARHLLPDPVVLEMAAHFWGLGSVHAERDLNFAPRAGLITLQDTLNFLRLPGVLSA